MFSTQESMQSSATRTMDKRESEASLLEFGIKETSTLYPIFGAQYKVYICESWL